MRAVALRLKLAAMVRDRGEDDDARFVFVSGRLPNFIVHGWFTMGEARRLRRRLGEG